MKSVLLQISAKYILPVQIILSFIYLLRGHNDPGGGFIGGLLAAAAFSFAAIAFSVANVEKQLRVDPLSWATLGLACILLGGVLGLLGGSAFLLGVWGGSLFVPFVGDVKLGSPLLFDLGVFLLISGCGTSLIFSFLRPWRAE